MTQLLKKWNAVLLAVALGVAAGPAAAAAPAKPARTKAKRPAKAAAKKKAPSKAATKKAAKRVAAATQQRRTKRKQPAKPKTTRFSIRNPGQLLYSWSGNDAKHIRVKGQKQRVSKDDIRMRYGMDPMKMFAMPQTLLETELQASLDLDDHDTAIKAIQAIAKDTKKTEKLLGKKGWTLKVKPKKLGTLQMEDFYADDPGFSLMRHSLTARWRSVQKLDANGKPLDDRQQLNVKAGRRMLQNNVVVRVEAGAEVAGQVKQGRIRDPRLKKYIDNHRLEENPANLIHQVLPKIKVSDVLDKPLVDVSQERYKFEVLDDQGVPVGEGSIDVVVAKPTAYAKKVFGKQLKAKTRFGRVEYEGEHINPQLSPAQQASASSSSRPHGAADPYSNTLMQSGDIRLLTGIAGRLTKATGAKAQEGNKVFESMSRLGFFDHLPKGPQTILDAQRKNEARFVKKVKEHNPGFVD